VKRIVALCMLAALALPGLAAPSTLASQAVDCEQLDAEMARAEQARRQAAEDSDNAWKAVVPFAVLARKARAKSAQDEADKRLAALKPQAQRCRAGSDDAQ
jgi:hypothetical protein